MNKFFIKCINNKNKKEYFLINDNVLNATNNVADKSLQMCLYADMNGVLYVRDFDEFNEKFTIL